MALSLFGAGTLAGQSALGALDAAADRFREIQALCAEFDQVLEVRLLRRTIESHGRLCQERPNRFAMRFAEPERLLA